MTTDLAPALSGVDAARRVGWAKFYEAEDAAMMVTGYMLAMTRMLKDGGDPREARLAMLRCINRLQASEYGRSLVGKVLEVNGYLADWLAEGMTP
jgi:hypothetical protein